MAGPNKPPPNPIKECSPIAAPLIFSLALITKPAVKVEESAMMKIAWPAAKAKMSHQDWPVELANATPITALVIITMHTHFCRPIRNAISFPRMDEGTPKKLITPAKVVVWGVLFVIYERRNGWGSKAN